MKRTATVAAVFALIFLGAPSPANAAPAECDILVPLGFVCARVVDGVVLDTAGKVLGTVDPVIERVEVPVPTTVPGPTRTVTAPAPAPRTVTRSAAPATVTESATPSTQTVTATPTPTNTAGQNRNGSGTLEADSGTPTLAEPPPVAPDSVDLLPDTPVAAAATGSVLGLAAGILIGVALLYVVYRRGQLDGEKATLQEFLGHVRGLPQPGRHRA